MNDENTISKAKDKNITLRIVQDIDPQNPRTEWDNFGKMFCSHNRYDLGDDIFSVNSKDFNNWDEVYEYLGKEYNAVVILPLYLYDHSGITMRTTPFSCHWDSGQVGYIFADRETILKEFNAKRISKKMLKKVNDILHGEVETYDQYLTGDVWGFTLTKTVKCDSCGSEDEETIDSCFGFYGYKDYEKQMKEYIENKYHYLFDKLE